MVKTVPLGASASQPMTLGSAKHEVSWPRKPDGICAEIGPAANIQTNKNKKRVIIEGGRRAERSFLWVASLRVINLMKMYHPPILAGQMTTYFSPALELGFTDLTSAYPPPKFVKIARIRQPTAPAYQSGLAHPNDRREAHFLQRWLLAQRRSRVPTTRGRLPTSVANRRPI